MLTILASCVMYHALAAWIGNKTEPHTIETRTQLEIDNKVGRPPKRLFPFILAIFHAITSTYLSGCVCLLWISKYTQTDIKFMVTPLTRFTISMSAGYFIWEVSDEHRNPQYADFLDYAHGWMSFAAYVVIGFWLEQWHFFLCIYLCVMESSTIFLNCYSISNWFTININIKYAIWVKISTVIFVISWILCRICGQTILLYYIISALLVDLHKPTIDIADALPFILIITVIVQTYLITLRIYRAATKKL